MDKQFIISLGREYGSGGHVIADKLAEHYSISLYNSNMISHIAKEKNVDPEELSRYDELPKSRLFSRSVRGLSNSPSEVVANMQFEFLRDKAEQGESFVIVGRCAETALEDHEALIPIFIYADMEKKIERIAKLKNISRADAKAVISVENKMRRMYHNYYCKRRWADCRSYDLCLNSSRLGIEETAEFIIKYIDEKLNRM